MAERVVIYCKQSGEPGTPITVRIEWREDGTIIPLLYWTPDSTCHKIISHSDSVPIAFLKEQGEGVRFKVQAEVIDTDKPDSELLHTRYETYLYLADKRYSQKNIIDGRYGHDHKEYVPVTLDVFPDGGYELLYFRACGARYMVERTAAVEKRGAFHAGGIGIWHKVAVRLVNAENDEDPDPNDCVQRFAALYLELNKWFVSVAKPR